MTKNVIFIIMMSFGLFFHSSNSEAATYTGEGITLELPTDMEFVNARQGFVMEAVNPVTKSNMNITVAPYNGNELSYAEANQVAKMLYADFQNRGIKMVGSMPMSMGGHYGINAFGRTNASGYTLGHIWLYMFVHGKRYIVTYTFQEIDGGDFDQILASSNTLRCMHHR